MRTVEVNVYKFDELSEEAQEKVLIDFRLINVEDTEWWDNDGWLELSEEQMKESGIKMVHSSHIGKGFCQVKLTEDAAWVTYRKNVDGYYPCYTRLFKWDMLRFDNLCNRYMEFVRLRVMCQETFRKFLQIPKRLYYVVEYEFIVPDGKEDTEIQFKDLAYYTESERVVLERATKIFNDHVQAVLLEFDATYDGLTDDDQVAGTVKARGYEFTADGKQFH